LRPATNRRYSSSAGTGQQQHDDAGEQVLAFRFLADARRSGGNGAGRLVSGFLPQTFECQAVKLLRL